MPEVCPECGGRICVELRIVDTIWPTVDPKTGEVKLSFADVSPDKLVYEIVDSYCEECGRIDIETDNALAVRDGKFFVHVTEFGPDEEDYRA